MWRWSLDLPKGKPEGRRYFFSTYIVRGQECLINGIATPSARNDRKKARNYRKKDSQLQEKEVRNYSKRGSQ